MDDGHKLGRLYADASACAVNLAEVSKWFDMLRDLGPDFGYIPQPVKSVLAVDPSHMPEALKLQLIW